MSITVLVAGGQPIVRKGIRTVLESNPEIRVVGEVSDGIRAVEMAERLRPDVLLVDAEMSGLNGLEAVRQARRRAPHTRSLVLASSNADGVIHDAFRNGASGYLVKQAETVEVERAVRTVASGRRYLCPEASDRVFASYFDRPGGSYLRPELNAPRDAYDGLSDREREVLHLASEGKTNAQIADQLGISPRTVEVHRGNMMRKLKLKTKTEMIRYALQRGLIPA